MNFLKLSAALALSAVSSVAIASAQTMPGSSMSAPSSSSSMMATMVCRPAQTGEKPTAMMGSSALVCKAIAVSMKGTDGKMHMMGDAKAKAMSMPDSSGQTATQVNDSYTKMLNDMMTIGHAGN